MKTLLRMVVAGGLGWLAVTSVAQTATPATPAPTAAPAPAAARTAAPLTVDQQLAALQKKMQDWAQLGYYRDRNATLAAPAAGEQRVVFYGDSITELWGRSWKVSFGDKPYVDRGISGQTSAQMVVRFHQDVVDLHPKVVVMLAGTNDVAENTGPITPDATLDDFRAMLEMARANGIKVVVGS
ncbi:MAG TPA: GDSL-type esterase/lipase family protein, partial [Acidobacteriaceae bacterium]